jgi:heme exporter protein B
MKKFFILLQDDLLSDRSAVASAMTALFFLLMTVSLFSIALAPRPDILRTAAHVVLWSSVLLAGLLALESIWHRAEAQGQFDLLLLARINPACVALSKMAVHWLLCGLPAVVLSPVLLGVMGADITPNAVVALFLGTLYLSLLGSTGAILTFGARQPALLLVVIILPLLIPMFLLGLMASLAESAFNPYLLLQAALTLLGLGVLPWLGAKLLEDHWKNG